MSDYNYNATQDTTEHLLEEEVYLVQASGGKRFANYLIDLIVFYILLILLVGVFVVSSGSTSENPDEYSGWFSLAYLLSYNFYMFIMEVLLKGKSLGKLITGTRAVNHDGSFITAKTALYRSLSRAVPFEAFSALGSPSYPWHDKWTDTYVIDEKQSQREL